MSFEVRHESQPERSLKKLDLHLANRIIDKIDDALSENPVLHDAKSVQGDHGLFRLRIGKHRVLYRVNDEAKQIVVVKIDKQSRV